MNVPIIGLNRVALLVYLPPTRPLGPLPDPYPIPRGYLIPTGQKSIENYIFGLKRPKFLSQWEQLEVFTITYCGPSYEDSL